MNVCDLLESHSGFSSILNDSNFSLPVFSKKIIVKFNSSDALAICANYGISIEGSPSDLSSIILDESQKGLGITIKFNKKTH